MKNVLVKKEIINTSRKKNVRMRNIDCNFSKEKKIFYQLIKKNSFAECVCRRDRGINILRRYFIEKLWTQGRFSFLLHCFVYECLIQISYIWLKRENKFSFNTFLSKRNKDRHVSHYVCIRCYLEKSDHWRININCSINFTLFSFSCFCRKDQDRLICNRVTLSLKKDLKY
jgi:hypothetical protein